MDRFRETSVSTTIPNAPLRGFAYIRFYPSENVRLRDARIYGIPAHLWDPEFGNGVSSVVTSL